MRNQKQELRSKKETTSEKTGLWLLASCLLLLFSDSFAQQRGSIEGKVTDSATDEGLVGVNVLIEGTYYGASTDIDGKFEIKNVTAGQYTLVFRLLGYKEVQHTGVVVKDGEPTVVNTKLEETALSLGQEVVVVGQKPLMDPAETQSTRTISSQDIKVSAVQDVKDVVSQQVGVVAADNEIHIRGGRSYENAYLLNGINIQDPLAGTGFGLQLSSNSIEQMEIITGGYNAEYGQATSGIVNVKTKEGGDKYNLFFQYKTDNWGADKNSPSDFNSDDYQANIGGPEPITKYLLPALGINIPGEITLFGSFAAAFSDGQILWGQRYQNGQVVTFKIDPPSRLNSSIFYGTRFAPKLSNEWYGLGTITYKPSQTFKITYSYNGNVSINENTQELQTTLEYTEPTPGYQYQFQNILGNADVYTHVSTVQSIDITQTLSSNAFYDLKFAHFFTHLRADANGLPDSLYQQPVDVVTLPPQYYNTNRDTIGIIPGDGFYDYGNADTWHDHFFANNEVKFDLTDFFSEQNKFKAGFDMNFEEMQLVDIYEPWVGVMGLNNDVYQVYPAAGSAYGQETITTNGMILNLGLRFDYWFPGKYVDDAVKNPQVITIPQAIRDQYYQDTYNFLGRRWKGRISPRLGISHPVSDNQTLFLNYGHFSKWPRPQFVYAKLEPSTAMSTYQAFGNPNLNPETTVSYELGLRNQFTSDDVLTLTAYYKDIFDYVQTKQAQVSSASLIGQNFITYVNSDFTRSRGIEVEYRKRIGNWFNGTLSGSYSVATGKSSSEQEGILAVQGLISEAINETYMSWDRPLQLSANLSVYNEKQNGLWGFGKGILDDFETYVRIFFESGKRYTPYYSTGTYAANGEPLYAVNTQNPYSKVGANWFYVDLNFEKYFTLGGVDMTFMIEVKNLFNDLNSDIINPVTGRAYQLGDPVPPSWNDPRYPDLTAPIDPYPLDQSRYLPPRNIRIGISVKL
ncbi:MAG TPA: TonB-dependent receptor [Candidatus Acidoferrales bacterium]|nr:TonB-dependent receptor [Candidatus Acidoferrales bacterium]